jgi:hypothetical protein
MSIDAALSGGCAMTRIDAVLRGADATLMRSDAGGRRGIGAASSLEAEINLAFESMEKYF